MTYGWIPQPHVAFPIRRFPPPRTRDSQLILKIHRVGLGRPRLGSWPMDRVAVLANVTWKSLTFHGYRIPAFAGLWIESDVELGNSCCSVP